MSIISKVAKAWRILTKEGFFSLLRAMRGYKYYRHKSIWFALPLNDDIRIAPPRFRGRLDFDNPGGIISWIEKHNIPGTNDRNEISKMKDRGHLFVGVMDQNEIMGYLKIGWDTVYVLDYDTDIQLPEGDYFILDFYISPEGRGRGGGAFALTALALEMKQRGFKRGVMHVRIDKIPMLKSGASTGYQEIGRVDYTSLLGMRLFRPYPGKFIFRSLPRQTRSADV